MQFILEACRDLEIQALHLEVERSNSPGSGSTGNLALKIMTAIF